MTDNETIETLKDAVICIGQAPFVEKVAKGEQLKSNIIDLINRKNAEIERLTAIAERNQEKYERTMTALKAVLDKRADHSEAIKEFGVKWHKKLKTARAKLFEEPRLVRQAFKIASSITDEVIKEFTERNVNL